MVFSLGHVAQVLDEVHNIGPVVHRILRSGQFTQQRTVTGFDPRVPAAPKCTNAGPHPYLDTSGHNERLSGTS